MRAFLVSNAGAAAAEYALVLTCIALLGMGALSLFAANVRSLFNSAVDWVAASSGSGGNSGSSLGNGPGHGPGNGGQNFWYWSGGQGNGSGHGP